MATFIEISPDAFSASFKQLQELAKQARTPGNPKSTTGLYDDVRRPVRGIQIKQNSVVTLQVRTFDGRNIPLVDAGGSVVDASKNTDMPGWTNIYTNFLVQSVKESRQEKAQIIETFGESYVFFYGEHARVIDVSGVLLNTEDFNWRAEFWDNYENRLRGTRCVQSKSRVYMSWDDIIVGGFMMLAEAVDSSEAPYHVLFSFRFFVTDYANVSRIGFPDFPKGAEEVNLDPNQLDTTGEGIGNLISDTLAVRELNEATTSQSLLGTLRSGLTATLNVTAAVAFGFDGSITAGVGAASDEQLPSIDVDVGDSGALGIGLGLGLAGGGGFVLSVNLGASLLGSPRIRVPLGFGGGAVFDDVQVALASALDDNGSILINSQIGDLEFAVQGQLLPKTLPARYGKIRENTDEYVFRIPKPPDQPVEPPDIFESQKADDAAVTDSMAAIYEAFGIPVDPSSEVMGAALGVGFATISVGV